MMTSKEFKIVFGDVAKANGFLKAFGGWYKESCECIGVLELRKSKFGDNYLLNIKIFIQGAFDRKYVPSKDLIIKTSIGHISECPTKEYSDIFYFDEPMKDTEQKDILKKYGNSFHFTEPIRDDTTRIEKLEKLFKNYVNPFVDKTLTKLGIKELAEKGEITLLPAVKEELQKLLG